MSTPAFSSMCRRCQSQFTKIQRSRFSTSLQSRAQPDGTRAPPQTTRSTADSRAVMKQLATNASNEAQSRPRAGASPTEPYHLNVYSHKHNIHLTFSEPSRDIIISYSSGNIGLRKAQRGTFDAAYQLSSYMFRKMAEKSWKVGGKKSTATSVTLNDPKVRDRGIEVIMRGYGTGREAFQKALLGAEGRIIKGLVKKVTDATRLKFGGVRSRATRRLG